MKKVLFLLSALILCAFALAACGGEPAPVTEKVALAEGDSITFEAIGGSERPNTVKIVFTTVEEGHIFFQAFSDGELMSGGQMVYENLDLFPGLMLQPGVPTQLIIQYQIGNWRPLPQ